MSYFRYPRLRSRRHVVTVALHQISGFLISSALSSMHFAAGSTGRPAALTHPLKSWWPLTLHIESAFKCDAYLADQTVIEQSPQNSDSVRDAAGWVELGQRVVWIRSP